MSIYKECDIRGIYGEEFTEKDAFLIGQAIGTKLNGEIVLVSGDVRPSTPLLKEHLIEGLRVAGADVTDLGMLPTPAFYYAVTQLQCGGGVTVTASHNPYQYNGFKLIFGKHPVGAEDIQQIRGMVEKGIFSTGKGTLSNYDILPSYRQSMRKFFPKSSQGLSLVVDGCNGAMSELGPELLAAAGHRVYDLFPGFDGTFPNRDPNPAVSSNLKALQQAVLVKKADMGIAFDGDGDRVVFVDNLGRVLSSERSLVIFIREYLMGKPAPVVYDIKSSSVVKDAVLASGGESLQERSGHAFIKRRFLDHKAALAGEISGHFFFAELGYDDGLYAALRMAEILRNVQTSLSDLADGIPQTLITPDLRFFCPYSERDTLLKDLETKAGAFPLSKMDGLRIELAGGWLLVRKSVTEEGMTLRAEARDADGMKQILRMASGWIPKAGQIIETYLAPYGLDFL